MGNTSDNQDFSSIPLPFQIDPDQKKKSSYQKVGRNVQTLAANSSNARGGMLDWCKFGYFKKEEREIDYFCCR